MSERKFSRKQFIISGLVTAAGLAGLAKLSGSNGDNLEDIKPIPTPKIDKPGVLPTPEPINLSTPVAVPVQTPEITASQVHESRIIPFHYIPNIFVTTTLGVILILSILKLCYNLKRGNEGSYHFLS